jgi:hypothetical protein
VRDDVRTSPMGESGSGSGSKAGAVRAGSVTASVRVGGQKEDRALHPRFVDLVGLFSSDVEVQMLLWCSRRTSGISKLYVYCTHGFPVYVRYTPVWTVHRGQVSGPLYTQLCVLYTVHTPVHRLYTETDACVHTRRVVHT